MKTNYTSAEREREITIDFLRLVNESAGTRDLVQAAATFFQQQSGCEAVGIRLREGEDYPYYEARGFPEEFVLAETSLCAKDDANCVIRDSSGSPIIECMCGNVICGRFNPAKRFFTERGSFWTNSTTELLASTTEADRQSRTRNRCNGEGYEAVALLPLRFGDQRLGLLQLNDRRKGVFTLEIIRLWERLADQLAVALSKFRAEEALRESEKKYKNLFEASLDGTYQVNDEGVFILMNPAGARIFGYEDPAEILGKNALEFWRAPGDRALFRAELKAKKKLSAYPMRARKRNGEPIELESSAIIVEDEKGNFLGIDGILRDVTARKRAEEQLKESESKFRSLAEQALVGTYIIQGGAFKYVNRRFAEIFGYTAEELVENKAPLDLVISEDRHVVESNVRKGKFGETPDLHYDFRGLKKNGDIVQVEVFGSRSLYQGGPAIIGVILDISEKKKLESQLLQSQKMEAVGQLTGGIAHDFNNILSAIIGYASLMQMKMSKENPFRSYVEQILAGTDRAANLTRSLLTFSRKQVSNPMPVDVNAIIGRVNKLLHSIIGEDIDLRLALAPGDLIVNADAGQLEQVLMNLATNARDAMPKGGLLSLESSSVDSRDVLERQLDLAGNKYALISVTDTGVGMDDKTRKKIFEPFFTTKDPGKGTGLGLSMAYGIVKQHQGYIQCYSEPGKGTTFKVYLPLLPSAGDGETINAKTAAPGELRGGPETILVAEDDEALRNLAKRVLQDFGYAVIEAVDGEDAIKKFEYDRDTINLVLCDVIMPKKNGRDVWDKIKKMSPDARIIFTSGYPADIVHQKDLLAEDAEIVLKPIPPTMLLRKVREALDKK